MGLLIVLAIFIIWKIYETVYYKSENFLNIKAQVQSYVNDCNELNAHIENLKSTYLGINQLDYGQAQYHDKSQWNYKRPELKKQRYAPNIYNCSRTVCDNARKQPFKYICKYFNLKANEETLSKIENVLNNFEAAEQGKIALKAEKERIIHTIKYSIPFLIRILGKKKFERKLGFENIDFSTTYFPRFIFSYVSSGGNASTQCDIIMNLENLNRFISYLSEVVKFKKSALGQRALMTSSLRRKIVQRDNFTCKICGNSIHTEPNLLLEIDHIIPISKGGLTTEFNLQTLCWKCNRKKGAKVAFKSEMPNSPEASARNSTTTTIDEKECIESTLKKQETKVQKGTITIINAKKVEELNVMYDKDKGIYPPGTYLVGEDIPIGTYLLKSKQDLSGGVSIYESYQRYKEDEMLSYNSFIDDYHLSLRETGIFIEIQNADMQQI